MAATAITQSLLDLNWMDEDGNTELHLAAYNCDYERVKELVQQGADLNAKNKNLETPLHAAGAAATATSEVRSCSIKIIKFLIYSGAEAEACLLDNETDGTFLQCLLLEGNLTPSQFNEVATCLVENNYAELFNHSGGITGQTPLMWAVHKLEVTKQSLYLLHMNGVNFQARDNFGSGILSFAVEGRRSLSLIKYLIRLGADWRELDSNLRSLLHIAASSDHVDVLPYLIALGLDVNQCDSCGNTPLHLVSQLGRKNSVEIAKILIENGAEMSKNDCGLTSLSIALARGDSNPDKNKIVDLLINNSKFA